MSNVHDDEIEQSFDGQRFTLEMADGFELFVTKLHEMYEKRSGHGGQHWFFVSDKQLLRFAEKIREQYDGD